MSEEMLSGQAFREIFTGLREILLNENRALKELDFNKATDLSKNKFRYVRQFTDPLKKLKSSEGEEDLPDPETFFAKSRISSTDIRELMTLIAENRTLLKKSIDLQADLVRDILRVAGKKVPLYNDQGSLSPEKPQPRFGCGA